MKAICLLYATRMGGQTIYIFVLFFLENFFFFILGIQGMFLSRADAKTCEMENMYYILTYTHQSH